MEIQTASPPELRDALYALSIAKDAPDAALLDDLVRRFPQFGGELTDFAISIAIDALHGEAVVEAAKAALDPNILSPAEGEALFGPAQQAWVLDIPIMQQSVLFAAIRAPDGLRKNHPIKVLMRWYRRSILLSAFDKRALEDPFEAGGGSFTGPFELHHAQEYFGCSWGTGMASKSTERIWEERPWAAMDRMRKVYLDYVDEIPHHFQLHFMHAAQIVGVHHPIAQIRDWWRTFYLMIVNDAHLQPETDAAMNLRLSDNSAEWLAREEVTAK